MRPQKGTRQYINSGRSTPEMTFRSLPSSGIKGKRFVFPGDESSRAVQRELSTGESLVTSSAPPASPTGRVVAILPPARLTAPLPVVPRSLRR